MVLQYLKKIYWWKLNCSFDVLQNRVKMILIRIFYWIYFIENIFWTPHHARPLETEFLKCEAWDSSRIT